MDHTKIGMVDIRSFESPRLKEVEREVRRELANVRMDIYTAPTAHTGNIRKLKKALARVMTVQTEKNRKVGK